MKNSQKTEDKSVSVALCTYNGALFLEEQLESILKQDYSKVGEIVCVDDCSSDETFQILERYAAKDHRFRLFRNDCNLGYVANFEKALKLCSSDLIAISDQDDIWDSRKVSILAEAIGDHLMAFSDNEYVNAENISLGKKFSDTKCLQSSKDCLNFALFNSISGHLMLINRDLLRYSFPFHAVVPFDYWLAFHAAQRSEIQYVDKVLVRYRQHANNALGAFGVRRSRKEKEQQERENKYKLFQLLAGHLDESLVKEKVVLEGLVDTYWDRSLKSRCRKVSIYLENRTAFLLFKKRNEFRKFIYCLKMFWS